MTPELTPREALFFAGSPRERAALPLYEALRARLLERLPDTVIEPRKTQISFKNRRLFGWVSTRPFGRAADRPKVWLSVGFGLPYRLDSPRIAAASEPCPNRWTHHLMVGSAAEIDGELLDWLAEAAAFAAAKR